MARFTNQLLLLFIAVALTIQGCDCKKTNNGNGDGGDRDGDVGDGQIGDGQIGDGQVGDGSLPDVPPFVPPDVHVLITADNAYGFGYGSNSSLVHYFEGVEDGSSAIFNCSETCSESDPCSNGHACDIFGTCNADRMGPETYVVPGNMAPQDGFLYIVTWSDESITQGLIAQFRAADGSSPTVYTGSNAWQVCATGIDKDPVNMPGMSGGPSVAEINAQIAACNATEDNATFSGGWIGNALGNNPKGAMELSVITDPMQEPNEFAGLCQGDGFDTGDTLDEAARWMWFDDDRNAPPSAFQASNMGSQQSRPGRGDFFIFRLPISAVIIID